MGRPQTEATRAKIRAALLGRRCSPEHRANIRAALRNRDPAIYQKVSATLQQHGHAGGAHESRTYTSWHMMRQRCLNPKATGYENYGGRGITIDPPWLVFENFLAGMGERPDGMSLDRIDVDGNYELSNCRWATSSTQTSNRRKRGK